MGRMYEPKRGEGMDGDNTSGGLGLVIAAGLAVKETAIEDCC